MASDNTSHGPLSGMRVIEMAGFGPAPFCAMMLADMGADVVRVERAGAPERGLPIPAKFEVLNRNRRSIAIDLKTSEGQQTLHELIAKADVLIEGFRPGVMERLNAGPQTCLALQPALVYGRVTGYGQQGPMAGEAGHDLNYIALSGVLDAIGQQNGEPVVPLNLVGDFGGGGMLLLAGVLAAYVEALRSGEGQVVDAAMTDGANLLMASTYGLKAAGHWAMQRGTNVLDGGAPWYSAYRTKDGHYVSVAAVEPRFYENLVVGLGMDLAALPPRNNRADWSAIRSAFAQAIGSLDRVEVDERLRGLDACYAPVLSMSEAPDHPQMLARNAFIAIEGVVQPAPAPRFSRTPSQVKSRPPEPGCHTQEVFAEWLGRAT
ncbi:MAG: CoA transferase [Alcaligenaceae bacterium]|nr:CoA transferase [Alcaligenaceae bacterium]